MNTEQVNNYIGRHVRLLNISGRPFYGIGDGTLQRSDEDRDRGTVTIVCDDGVAYSRHPFVRVINSIEEVPYKECMCDAGNHPPCRHENCINAPTEEVSQ